MSIKGAVPHAIVQKAKYFSFKPPVQNIEILPEKLEFFYKLNCNTDMKLLKQIFDQNGFKQLIGEIPKSVQTYSSQADWILLWTSKVLKNSAFQILSRYQKVNQFPKSIELTRKDNLVCQI